MQFNDALQILHLGPEASLDDLKAAYRKLAFACHPDLHPNDPNAAYKFQQLNQAYILVQSRLQKTSSSTKDQGTTRHQTQKDTQQSTAQAKQERPKTSEQRSSFGENKTGSQAQKAKAYGTRVHRPRTHGPKARGHKVPRNKAHSASKYNTPRATQWTKKNRPRPGQHSKFRRDFKAPGRDELKNILHDPFAQEVFEEIYNYIQAQKKRSAKSAPKVKKGIALSWGNRYYSLDLSRFTLDGLKDWLRSQLDDHQTIYLPSQHLTPGATIRFQVKQSSRTPPKSVTTTLPPGYLPGQDIRFKGLGRKLGKWTGDLYLKVLPKTTS